MSQAWKAAGGAVVGGALGGPLGAMLGAGIGAMMGGSGVPEVPGQLEWFEESDGLVLRLTASHAEADFVAVRVVRPDGALRKGHSLFADEDGDFLLLTPWLPDGVALFFLPHAATIGRDPGDAVVCLYTRDDDSFTGASQFQQLPRKPAQTWSMADQIRPYVHLAMRVARADGSLDRAEVRVIRQFFDLDDDDGRLRAIMKERSSAPVENLVVSLAARLPDFAPDELLELLCAVARADAVVAPSEVEVIARVAEVLGVPEELWGRMLGQPSTVTPSTADAWAALSELGLTPPCTRIEIKKAYRRLARQHHPDRFARQGEEAIARATKKTIRIREAYELLVAVEAWNIQFEPQEQRPTHGGSARAGAAREATRTERNTSSTAPPGPKPRRHPHQAPTPAKSNNSSKKAARPETPSDTTQDQSAVEVAGDVLQAGRGMAGLIGAAIGFFIGLPAGGIGALPAAGIGFAVGYFFPELGCGCLILLFFVGGWLWVRISG